MLGAAQAGVVAAPQRQTRAASNAEGAQTWHVIVGADSPDHAIMELGPLPSDLSIDVGDTVVWTSHSQQMHTVTFEQHGVPPPYYAPGVVFQTGGPHYDGSAYASSAPMTARPRAFYPDETFPTYTLTFVKPGTFTYVDVLYHSLTGRIHVRPAGTPYPLSPAQVGAAATRQVAAAMTAGHTLAAQAAHESTNHQVTLGIGNGHVSVNRFFPAHIVVHRGDTVTFTNRDPINTHTVWFDPTGQNDPTGQWPQPPAGSPRSPERFDGTWLWSGPLGTAQGLNVPDYATSYQVKFVQVGHFTFFCDLNADLGMTATVDVLR